MSQDEDEWFEVTNCLQNSKILYENEIYCVLFFKFLGTVLIFFSIEFDCLEYYRSIFSNFISTTFENVHYNMKNILSIF